MKRFAIVLFILFGSFLAVAQQDEISKLDRVPHNAVRKEHQSIIYGKFLRKAGILYTDNQHFIRVINIDTKEVSSFVVKRFERGAKECDFCFYLKPGNYQILNYQFQKNTWYGDKIITTPIFRDLDYNDNMTTVASSASTPKIDRKPFIFTVQDDAITYLGTWDFSSGIVAFRNEKDQTDKTFPDTYPSLPFDKAAVSIPE